jgi:hypothetical protein
MLELLGQPDHVAAAQLEASVPAAEAAEADDASAPVVTAVPDIDLSSFHFDLVAPPRGLTHLRHGARSKLPLPYEQEASRPSAVTRE